MVMEDRKMDKTPFRPRVDERERQAVVVILAGWLKKEAMDFKARHEAELRAYNSYSGPWQQRRELRDKILQGEEQLLERLQLVSEILVKWTRKVTGRPWIWQRNLLENYGYADLMEQCDKILREETPKGEHVP